jgi:hypothetical protein
VKFGFLAPAVKFRFLTTVVKFGFPAPAVEFRFLATQS